MEKIRHNQLKEASRLLNTSITKFAANLTKPDGTKGVSHTAVIRVAQGYDHTEWIQHEIDAFIARARAEFPEYYKKKIAAS